MRREPARVLLVHSGAAGMEHGTAYIYIRHAVLIVQVCKSMLTVCAPWLTALVAHTL